MAEPNKLEIKITIKEKENSGVVEQSKTIKYSFFGQFADAEKIVKNIGLSISNASAENAGQGQLVK